MNLSPSAFADFQNDIARGQLRFNILIGDFAIFFDAATGDETASFARRRCEFCVDEDANEIERTIDCRKRKFVDIGGNRLARKLGFPSRRYACHFFGWVEPARDFGSQIVFCLHLMHRRFALGDFFERAIAE